MCYKLLTGKTMNLRLMEKTELHMLADWLKNPRFTGGYESQETIGDLEKSGFKREGTIRKALWTGKGK